MNLLNGIAARYAQAWGDQVHAHDAALKQLWQLAFREAQVQTFADAYLAIAICFAVAFLMVPFRRRRRPPPTRTETHAVCPQEWAARHCGVGVLLVRCKTALA